MRVIVKYLLDQRGEFAERNLAPGNYQGSLASQRLKRRFQWTGGRGRRICLRISDRIESQPIKDGDGPVNVLSNRGRLLECGEQLHQIAPCLSSAVKIGKLVAQCFQFDRARLAVQYSKQFCTSRVNTFAQRP